MILEDKNKREQFDLGVRKIAKRHSESLSEPIGNYFKIGEDVLLFHQDKKLDGYVWSELTGLFADLNV